MDSETQRAVNSYPLPFANRVVLQGQLKALPKPLNLENHGRLHTFFLCTERHVKGERLIDAHFCVAKSPIRDFTRKILRPEDYLYVEGHLSAVDLGRDTTPLTTRCVIVDNLLPLDPPITADNAYAVSLRKLSRLKAFIWDNEYVCPQPQEWARLVSLLQTANADLPPPNPLILNGWEADDQTKANRLDDHLEYAWEHGLLNRVDRFLRELTPAQWYPPPAHSRPLTTSENDYE